MTYRNLNRIIILLILIGFITSSELVIKEITSGGACPVIGEIPACYLATIYFLFIFTTHIVGKKNILFFIFSSLGLALSLFASVGNILGMVFCPVTLLNIPLCFIAFIVFVLIVVLKFQQLKKNKPY